MRANSIIVEYRAISLVKSYENSAHIHNRAQHRKVKKFIERYGQLAPIIIDDHNTIVDGHLVRDIIEELGYDEIAVVVVKSRAPEEVRAIRLALNRLPEDSKWNDRKLKEDFKFFLDIGFDIELTGFDSVEIDMVLSIDNIDNGIVEDPITPPQRSSIPVSRPGDFWLLGEHRILCGDARGQQSAYALFDGEYARMMFTDPPYNVRIDRNVTGLGQTRHREFAMASGEMSENEFKEFLLAFLTSSTSVLRDGAIAYVCIDWRHVDQLIETGKNAGFELKNLIAWIKTNAGMGSFYRSQHELIPVFKWGEATHLNNFELGQKGRSRSNVWQYAGMNTFSADRDKLLKEHPTIKPVALVADAIKDVSLRQDIVFDPFLGSGTTVIAAEETGRRCYGIELDPVYTDLAIKRWQDATGYDAVHSGSNLSLKQIEEIRNHETLLLPPPTSMEGEE